MSALKIILLIINEMLCYFYSSMAGTHPIIIFSNDVPVVEI